jgi:hypothetical protein
MHKSSGSRELASMVTQIQVDVAVASRCGSDSRRYHGDFMSEMMQSVLLPFSNAIIVVFLYS